MTLDVETHLVQGEVVSLGHLLLVGVERCLGLLDVEEVGPPQVDVQHPDEAALEQLAAANRFGYTTWDSDKVKQSSTESKS